jgi:hypothetical protein
MFVKQKSSGHLIEVLEMQDLYDPSKATFKGRLNIGEDLPEPEHFDKTDTIFPSGESLPKCWVDTHYRDQELTH